MIDISKEEISKQFKRSVALILMGAVGTASVFSAGAFSRKVDICVDGNVTSAITLSSDTNQILRQVGIDVSSEDEVERYEGENGTLKLNVKKAFEVTVTKKDKTVTLKKASGTVQDAINESDIELDENDIANFDLDAKLTPEMEIAIEKGVEVTLIADGEKKETLVPEGTVCNALDFLNMDLSSEDLINVDVFSSVYENMEIKISRVSYREVTRIEEIPYKTVVKQTDLLSRSTQQITTHGKAGQREVTVYETLVDGEISKSQEITSNVLVEPIDEIVLSGSKNNTKQTSELKTIQKSENTGNCKVVEGSATAYTAPKSAKTSTGATPIEGVTIAVNPKVIPYGSKVTVKSIGGNTIWKGIAQDTGGALKNGSAVVDLYMNNRSDCINFGRKKVKVYYET